MKKLIWILPALALAASCASVKIDRTQLDDPAVREPLPPLTLNPGFDVFMLRVDLRRAVHDGIEFNSKNEMQKIQSENEYHFMVVDLGGGLILDYNNNLCLDLLRVYGLTDTEHYKVVVEGSLRAGVPSLVERKGGAYRSERRGGPSGLESGTISGTSVMDDKKRRTIAPEGDMLVYTVQRSDGIRITRHMEKKSGGRVVIFGVLGETLLASLQDSTLTASDRLTIEHHGDRLEFAGFTLIRTERSVFVFDRHYRGFELRRDGNEVRYLVNGKLLRTYRLVYVE